ncbi:tetratricopeptide repeat protein [Flammeovirga sp. SJP92]|uniref:tetratricopeptide repeat protein n=1 Tax=Flammeovirga sp. SJP92 TaxID=1775430 RepID=UPI000789891B|nr:tetratricopeptide repeat protein [Flammeovirga sp. SJP92]KXX68300.1 hypothetical protein AVL50_21180 [Flammeovirga sp. SJP92]
MTAFLRSFTILFFLIIYFNSANAQKSDSLWGVWIDETIDQKERVNALNEYSEHYLKINKDSALHFIEMSVAFAKENGIIEQQTYMQLGRVLRRNSKNEEAIQAYKEALIIAEKTDDSLSIANSLYLIGVSYYYMGDYEHAISYYKESKNWVEMMGNKRGVANISSNIGIINMRQNQYDSAANNFEESIRLYIEVDLPHKTNVPMLNYALLKERLGDYQGAMDLYMKSLAINEKEKDESSIAYVYTNIAQMYQKLGDNDKFFEYNEKSLDIWIKLNNKRNILYNLTNIGSIYFETGDYDKALEYFNKCVPLSKEIKDKNGIANVLLKRGVLYIETNQLDNGIKDINSAFDLYKQLKDGSGIALSHQALGKYYTAIGKNKLAITNLEKAYELAVDSDIEIQKNVAEDLYRVYEKAGNKTLAFEAYRNYIIARDSIGNDKNQKEIVRKELKYNYDKKALADSLAFENQKAIQTAKLEKSTTQLRLSMVILLIVIISVVLLYRRNQTIKNQNSTITSQNEKLTTLTDELKGLNENLEKKVEERTFEITKINKELKASDERYAYALDASNDGIWDYNVEEDQISFSPAIYTMLGFEPYEFPETRDSIYDLLHSEEKKIETRKAHHLFAIRQKTDFLEDEYRLVGKNGKVVWVQSKGKIVEKDEQNKPLRIVGTHTDITAQKLKSQEMLEAILRTEDAERSRISKEIHDGLQQTLIISFMNIRHFRSKMKDIPESVKEKFELGWKYLERSIEEARGVAHVLMPKSIVDYGVLAACQMLIDDMNSSTDEITFDFQHNLASERLPNQQIEITLYRILQESLNNVMKYAKASEVNIQLYDYEDTYSLTVEDNGIGFDTSKLKDKEGHGFRNIRNRLDAINGSLEVDSREGDGTTIIVEISKTI